MKKRGHGKGYRRLVRSLTTGIAHTWSGKKKHCRGKWHGKKGSDHKGHGKHHYAKYRMVRRMKEKPQENQTVLVLSLALLVFVVFFSGIGTDQITGQAVGDSCINDAACQDGKVCMARTSKVAKSCRSKARNDRYCQRDVECREGNCVGKGSSDPYCAEEGKLHESVLLSNVKFGDRDQEVDGAYALLTFYPKFTNDNDHIILVLETQGLLPKNDPSYDTVDYHTYILGGGTGFNYRLDYWARLNEQVFADNVPVTLRVKLPKAKIMEGQPNNLVVFVGVDYDDGVNFDEFTIKEMRLEGAVLDQTVERRIPLRVQFARGNQGQAAGSVISPKVFRKKEEGEFTPNGGGAELLENVMFNLGGQAHDPAALVALAQAAQQQQGAAPKKKKKAKKKSKAKKKKAKRKVKAKKAKKAKCSASDECKDGLVCRRYYKKGDKTKYANNKPQKYCNNPMPDGGICSQAEQCKAERTCTRSRCKVKVQQNQVQQQGQANVQAQQPQPDLRVDQQQNQQPQVQGGADLQVQDNVVGQGAAQPLVAQQAPQQNDKLTTTLLEKAYSFGDDRKDKKKKPKHERRWMEMGFKGPYENNDDGLTFVLSTRGLVTKGKGYKSYLVISNNQGEYRFKENLNKHVSKRKGKTTIRFKVPQAVFNKNPSVGYQAVIVGGSKAKKEKKPDGLNYDDFTVYKISVEGGKIERRSKRSDKGKKDYVSGVLLNRYLTPIKNNPEGLKPGAAPVGVDLQVGQQGQNDVQQQVQDNAQQQVDPGIERRQGRAGGIPAVAANSIGVEKCSGFELEAGKSYHLTKDLSGIVGVGGVKACIYLSKNDITFHCNGHKIRGPGKMGIEVSNNKMNAQLIGCDISGYETGITAAGNNHKLIGNNLHDNKVGLHLSSESTEITHNIFESNEQALYMNGAKDALITKNTFTGQTRETEHSSSIAIYRNSDNTQFTENTVSNNKAETAVMVKQSKDVVIEKNTITGNKGIGLIVERSIHAKVKENTIKNNEKGGLHIKDRVVDALIENNILCGNNAEGKDFKCSENSGSSGEGNQIDTTEFSACNQRPKFVACGEPVPEQQVGAAPEFFTPSASKTPCDEDGARKTEGGIEYVCMNIQNEERPLFNWIPVKESLLGKKCEDTNAPSQVVHDGGYTYCVEVGDHNEWRLGVNYQCANNDQCSPNDGCEQGICKGGEGSACQHDLFCLTGKCQNSVCVAAPAAPEQRIIRNGEGCGENQPGVCDEGLLCRRKAAVKRVPFCLPPAEVGAFCDADNECVGGGSCENSVCVGAPQQLGGAGAPCQQGDQCESGVCIDNDFCKSPIPDACEDDAGCGADAICQIYDDGTSNECLAEADRSRGNVCKVDSNCHDLYTCQNNVCELPQEDEQPQENLAGQADEAPAPQEEQQDAEDNAGPPVPEPQAPAIECVDSDRGVNKLVKGEVTIGDLTLPDVCEGNDLIEAACNNNDVADVRITCEHGCNQGVCRDQADAVVDAGDPPEQAQPRSAADSLERGGDANGCTSRRETLTYLAWYYGQVPAERSRRDAILSVKSYYDTKKDEACA